MSTNTTQPENAAIGQVIWKQVWALTVTVSTVEPQEQVSEYLTTIVGQSDNHHT